MAAQKFQYIVIHCLDTPYIREITKSDIQLWHLGALKNTDGTYNFQGKKYTEKEIASKRLVLDNGKTYEAIKTNGRGWSQVGYSDFIQRSGTLVNMVPYNMDNIIDSWEITNGATGYNTKSRHIALAGGWSKEGIKTGKKNGIYYLPEDLYTTEQIDELLKYIRGWKEIVPDLIIIGHNQIASKPCPNFNVQLFLEKYNLKNKISTDKPF
jgi:hypothetical protein